MKQKLPATKQRKPLPASFFLIVSFENQEVYYKLKERAENIFSQTLYESQPLPKWSHQFANFLDSPLGRQTRILSFKRRISREELPSLQKECLKFQEQLRKTDESFRIFPGYLTPYNLVLSFVEEDLHRIYLFHGAFAEIIYTYQSQKWICQSSAPDFFKAPEVIYFFTNLRESYVLSLEKR
ncbi:PF14385 domain protein [Leptospira broomii serovar Hurstbridge str. 5399]|uniref:PF14385 domain protein n=1 Tax=Leptospira broomii serovar Hurstbridge str. 5399 TaxID=1049789 RepID=T0F753_9LEPT|nr:DUF4416 family protein [Leptospira broomii]EQA43741.1 PF14385 domain protein [Leptospira broomii serovar Hurstbridge str. 5399]